MAGIARRLDNNARQIKPLRHMAFSRQSSNSCRHTRRKNLEQVHELRQNRSCRREYGRSQALATILRKWPSLLPLREKVDRRASGETDEGLGRDQANKAPHLSAALTSSSARGEVFPSPLRGRARDGGGGRMSNQSPQPLDPHPQSLPARGREAQSPRVMLGLVPSTHVFPSQTPACSHQKQAQTWVLGTSLGSSLRTRMTRGRADDRGAARSGAAPCDSRTGAAQRNLIRDPAQHHFAERPDFGERDSKRRLRGKSLRWVPGSVSLRNTAPGIATHLSLG